MASEHISNINKLKNLLNNLTPDEDQFEVSDEGLNEFYLAFDQSLAKRKLINKWKIFTMFGILVSQDEDVIKFEFNPKLRDTKMEDIFYLQVVEQEDFFVFLKCWLPLSIEIKNICPENKNMNKDELVQIIKSINKEVQAFQSRSEQLKELENGTRNMKVQIFSPDSRTIVSLKMALLSPDTDDKLVYSLILKYESSECLPCDVLIDCDGVPKKYKEILLQKASVFKEMFLWIAFCKYSCHEDCSSSSENDDSSMELDDETMELDDKTVELDDKTVELDEKTVELDDNGMELDDRKIND